MAGLPTGTVTFLFTDIEGSTRLWEQQPDAMHAALARHDALLRQAITEHGGFVFKTLGDGFCAAFATPAEAVSAAIAIQHAFPKENLPLRVRIAIHAGAAEYREGDYFGPALSRVARLLNAGHGGQILLSGATAAQLPPALLAEIDLRSLGVHRLRDIAAREAIFQLLAPGLRAEFPPLNTLDVAFRRGVVRTATVGLVVLGVISSLAVTAVRQARRADRNARLAVQQRLLAERQRYAAQTNLAQRELEAANRPRAEELLLMQRPGPGREDLRGWEWRYLWRQVEEDESLTTLSPGFWQVRGVAYSPDGKTLAASDLWGKVKLWDVATRRELASLGVGADGAGSSVTFSPDGRLLAWPSDLSHVRLWDLRRRRQAALLTARASGAGVTYARGSAGVLYGTVRFTPDGRLLAATGTDGTVRLWEVATGEALPPIHAHRKLVVDLAFSPDGRLLATSGGEESIALWDVTTRRELARLSRLGDMIGSLAFSPDGKILATCAHSSGAVNLWDVRTREIAATLSEPRAVGVSMAFSPDGRQLAAGGSDGVLRLWDMATRRGIAALVGHRKGISCIAFSPDGQTVATGSREGTVKLWRPAPEPREILHGTPAGVHQIVISPDGKTLASGNRIGMIALWDLQRDRLIRAFTAHTGDVQSLAFSPGGKRLASWGTDSSGRIWDLPTGHLKLTLPRKPAAFSADGRLLVCAGNGDDHTIHLWNLAAGRDEAVLRGHTHQIGRLLFSPGGKILVASGPGEEVVRLWDIARRRQIDPPLPGHVGWGGPFAFSPDGRQLATISGGEFIVYVWDVATHRRIVSLPGNTDQINWIQFSPDGRTLATGCMDGTIRLWSTASWSEVATMNDPDMDFGGAFSSDGTRLFTGGKDGSIRVWRAVALAEADVQCARVEYQHELDLAETLNDQSSVALADKLKKWAAVLPALDWLVRTQPRDASYRIRRGQALMQLGQWSKGAADLARGFALGADNLSAETDLARAQLAVGDLAAYRKACTALLDHMDAYTTEDAGLYSDAAFVCALAPHAVADPLRPVRLAEKARALQPQDTSVRTTLGAALYRDGRFDAAIRQLGKNVAAGPQGGSPEDWLFLAMTHHATGHAVLPRRYLERAERWIDAAMRPKPGTADASLPWDRRLQIQLLRHEAEGMLMKRP